MKFFHFVSKILSGNDILNEILTSIMGYNSITNMWKMMCNNPNLDFIIINAYTKFGENLSICSQDSERKRNYDRQMERRIQIQYSPPFSKHGYATNLCLKTNWL